MPWKPLPELRKTRDTRVWVNTVTRGFNLFKKNLLLNEKDKPGLHFTLSKYLLDNTLKRLTDYGTTEMAGEGRGHSQQGGEMLWGDWTQFLLLPLTCLLAIPGTHSAFLIQHFLLSYTLTTALAYADGIKWRGQFQNVCVFAVCRRSEFCEWL